MAFSLFSDCGFDAQLVCIRLLFAFRNKFLVWRCFDNSLRCNCWFQMIIFSESFTRIPHFDLDPNWAVMTLSSESLSYLKYFSWFDWNSMFKLPDGFWKFCFFLFLQNLLVFIVSMFYSEVPLCTFKLKFLMKLYTDSWSYWSF